MGHEISHGLTSMVAGLGSRFAVSYDHDLGAYYTTFPSQNAVIPEARWAAFSGGIVFNAMLEGQRMATVEHAADAIKLHCRDKANHYPGSDAEAVLTAPKIGKVALLWALEKTLIGAKLAHQIHGHSSGMLRVLGTMIDRLEPTQCVELCGLNLVRLARNPGINVIDTTIRELSVFEAEIEAEPQF